MPTKVTMPKLSLTMKEGTVGKWYKKEGEPVEKGEPIVELVSEKATYDLEAPASGILRKILVTEGSDVPVNQTLAIITGPSELFSETDINSTESPACAEPETRIPASPAAKRLAREHGIDLSLVKSSYPEGRISEEDVKRFIEEKSGLSPQIRQTIELAGLRKTSAERVSTSFRTAPHSTIFMETDFSKAMALHEKPGLSYTAILVKAASSALMEHPIINSSLEGDKIRIFSTANIGVAVATDEGLVVPVIREADKKPIKEIDTLVKELTEKARQKKLARNEVTGGTFTITNLGMYGIDFFTPIINPPEAAILGVGTIKEKLVLADGKVETKRSVMLSLSYDHRIVDGAPASQFLTKVKENIEKISFDM